MKFKTGVLVDGKRVTSINAEYDCWFDAIEAVLTDAGLYLYELDEAGNEVI